MAIEAPLLSTDYPANIGLLVDGNTVICLPFTEPTEIKPSDVAGTLEDLGAAAGGNSPVVDTAVLWASGRSRDFTGRAFIAGDLAGKSSLLTRDVTVQAIVAFDSAVGVTWTLITRGRGPGLGATEFAAFGVDVVATGATNYALVMRWMKTDGTEETVTSDSFVPPAPGKYTLVTVTRRWEAIDSVVCRFYVGPELVSEETSAVGDIGGGTTGKTVIGARWFDPPAAYAQYFDGWIDEIKVTDHEMSAEEVRGTWERLAVHQPAGVELVRDMAPPGAPIAENPASRVQRLVRFVGQGLGVATARIEEMQNLMPDRAYGAALEAWEHICRLTSLPHESLDVRRARVGAHLRRKGFTTSNIQGALEELLQVLAADIEILNFSNTYTDAFASIRSERWWALPAASWGVVGGAARVQAAATNDIRWNGIERLGPVMLMSIHSAANAYFGAKVTPTALPADGEAGLVLRHGARSDYLFLGLRNNGGVYQPVYQRFRGGAAVDAAPVALAVTSNTAHWFRIQPDPVQGIGLFGEQEFRLQWSTDGVAFDTLDDLDWVSDHDWLGFYARGADNSLAGALDVRFSEFLARTPAGTRPFRWYAYRDPGDPGSPDLLGAHALLQRFRHAYTEATVITSKSLLCDDTGSGCDRGPMGAI